MHSPDFSFEPDISRVGSGTNYRLAKESADQAITLVKDTQNLLPLSVSRQKNILLIGLGDEPDLFGTAGGTIPDFVEKLKAEGFHVNLYDTSQFTMRDTMQPVEGFVAEYDLVLYAAHFKPASNKTTLRINWAPPMGIDAPWFSAEIPTVFVSFGSPYHLMDVPRIPTYINAYAGNQPTVDLVIEKLMGRSEFNGTSPVDPFLGQWDTRL